MTAESDQEQGKPTKTITASDERVVRKIDWHLIPYLAWLFLLSFLDRNVHAIVNAKVGLSEHQYGLAVGVFFIVPSNLMLRRTSPSKWIARILLTWGVLSVCMAFANSFASLLVVRFLLGCAEAGFFPGIVYYFTLWYRPHERATRLALFYSASAVAGAFGGVLAYAILSSMEGVAGLHDYQWVFILEGLPSVVFAFVTWWYLPNEPLTAHFLTPSERQHAHDRLHSDDGDEINGGMEPGESTSTLTAIDPADAGPKQKSPTRIVMTSAVVWFFAVLYLALLIPFYSVAFYLPAFMAALGLSILDANLMTAPIYAVATITTIVWCHHSDRKRERPVHLCCAAACSGAGYVGLALCGHSTSMPGTAIAYAFTILAVAGAYPTIGTCLSWLLEALAHDVNVQSMSASDRKTATAVATALVVSIGNLGGFIGPQVCSLMPSFAYAHSLMAALMFLVSLLSLIGKHHL